MKKFVLLLFLVYGHNALAQDKPYFHYKDTEPYQEIIAGEAVSPALAWGNEIEELVPIGFTFRTQAGLVDSIYITQANLRTKENPNDRNKFTTISATELRNFNFKDRASVGESESIVSYKVAGNTGERIFKVQFKNMGLSTHENDFVNYQIWLYEGSGNVEFRFGPQNIEDKDEIVANGGVISGLVTLKDNIVPHWAVLYRGLPQNPSQYQDRNANYEDNNVFYPPGDSIIFVMEGKLLPTSTPSLIFSEIIRFSQVENTVSLSATNQYEGQIQQVAVYDITGVLLLTEKWKNNHTINLNNQATGLVFVVVSGDFGQVVKKVITSF